MELPLDTKVIRITLEERTEYLRFHLTGAYVFSDFEIALIAIHAACKERSCNRAIFDLRDVVGDMPNFDRFKLGVMWAEVCGSGLKAVMVAKKQLTNNLLENAAVNRYARVLTTYDEDHALKWLLQPDP